MALGMERANISNAEKSCAKNRAALSSTTTTTLGVRAIASGIDRGVTRMIARGSNPEQPEDNSEFCGSHAEMNASGQSSPLLGRRPDFNLVPRGKLAHRG